MIRNSTQKAIYFPLEKEVCTQRKWRHRWTGNQIIGVIQENVYKLVGFIQNQYKCGVICLSKMETWAQKSFLIYGRIPFQPCKLLTPPQWRRTACSLVIKRAHQMTTSLIRPSDILGAIEILEIFIFARNQSKTLVFVLLWGHFLSLSNVSSGQ